MFSMVLSDDVKENLLIFSNNLSYYYVFCVIISLVAVFVAIFCQKSLSEVESKREEENIVDGLENTDEEKSGLSASEENSADSADIGNSSTDNGLSQGTASSSLGNDSPVTSPDSSANSSANSVVTTERELLMDSIASQMTPDEIMTEREYVNTAHHQYEIERQQLEEIFKLVNDQKEVFKIDSVEDLEDQMKLYR